MGEDSWRRALRIAAGWVAGVTAGYLLVFGLVRFFLPQEFLVLVVLPTVGLLLAWVSPILLGQACKSWKVAWVTLACSLVATPIVVAVVIGIFFAHVSPR